VVDVLVHDRCGAGRTALGIKQRQSGTAHLQCLIEVVASPTDFFGQLTVFFFIDNESMEFFFI